MARDRQDRRHSVAGRQPGDTFGEVLEREAATAQAGRATEQTDALAATEQESGKRQEEEFGALALVRGGGAGAPIHAPGAVAPQIDRLGGLPLGLADEGAVGFGGKRASRCGRWSRPG